MAGTPSDTLRFLIGADGGGTGTRVKLAEAGSGKLLGVGEAGPSALAQGIEQAWRHIGEAVVRAFADAGQPVAERPACAIGLGLSGVHSPSRRDALLAHMPQDYAKVAIDTDAFTTLLGAHGGAPGSVVAAGTGAVGEAMQADGARVSVSGFGFPVGDEGSGAWMGLHAVQSAQRALDGRAPTGPLADAVLAVIGRSAPDVQDWCGRAGQNAYAKLAPLVFEHEHADPVAAELLALAVHELEAVAAALDPSATLPVAMCGSLGRRLEPRLAPALRARCVPAQGDSADGALLLVRRALAG